MDEGKQPTPLSSPASAAPLRAAREGDPGGTINTGADVTAWVPFPRARRARSPGMTALFWM